MAEALMVIGIVFVIYSVLYWAIEFLTRPPNG